MSVAVNTSPAGGIGNPGSWKRRASDDEDDRRSDVKKAKYSWYVTLESESPVPTDEDEESIYTEQGNETEFARDTSDTSTHTYYSSSNSESDVSFHVQYELASSSDNEEQFHSVSSSSGPDENIIAVEIVNQFSNCDGHADDSDDSRSSMDSDVKKTFFRTCVQCNGHNDNPLFQFCEKCYQLRKSYFPRDKLRRKPRAPKAKPTAKKLRTVVSNFSQELCCMDSGIGSGSSQELMSSQGSDTMMMNFETSSSSPSGMSTTYSPQISTTMASSTILCSQSSDVTVMSVERDEADSGTASKECDDSDSSSHDSDQGLLDLTKDKSKKSPLKRQLSSDNQPSQSLDALCNMCVERTASGIFHHGKSAHLYGCYDCAKKTYRMNGNRCPVCNRKSNKPAKLFL